MANLRINGNLNADSISQNNVNIFDKIYPVGSVYISINNTNPQLLFSVGEWEMLPENHTLWSINSGTGGGTIAAGLPNITGGLYQALFDSAHGDGCFSSFWDDTTFKAANNYTYSKRALSFNADAGATTKGIYGNSNTVQPPAIKVYMWRRIL